MVTHKWLTGSHLPTATMNNGQNYDVRMYCTVDDKVFRYNETIAKSVLCNHMDTSAIWENYVLEGK